MTAIRLVEEPTVIVLGGMQMYTDGLRELYDWVEDYAPQCLPEDPAGARNPFDLFPHECKESDNELLVELSGRKCYNSFGLKAGRKDNAGYISNLFGSPGKIPHASVLYHAKMHFFFGGLSRRVSHELIRHYVGADRDEEGSPSQESTRYTHHPGFFVVHPRMSNDEIQKGHFAAAMQEQYGYYQEFIRWQTENFQKEHGHEPKGMDRKRIYEAAAGYLPGAAATSFTWTTNPMALSKLFTERCDFAADLEIERFAKKLRAICYERWPNLFRASNPAYESGASK